MKEKQRGMSFVLRYHGLKVGEKETNAYLVYVQALNLREKKKKKKYDGGV